MLRIGKLADYALVILQLMAKRTQTKLSVDQIASNTQIPVPTVRKLMKYLTDAQLVRSERGPKGGYILAKAPEQVRIIDAVGAVEGPVALTECCDTDGSCDLAGSCDMEARWTSINELVVDILKRITLADLEAMRSTAGGQEVFARLRDATLAYPISGLGSPTR